MGIFKKHPAIILGLCLTVFFLTLKLIHVEFLDTLELKLYDMRMSLMGDSKGAVDIAIVDIDNDSIEKLGRWPWPRGLLAAGIRKINAGDPRIIGLNIIFSEPEESAGLKELRDLEELFARTLMDRSGSKGIEFHQAMIDAQTRLDNDRKLAEAIQESGKVVLPVFFKESAMSVGEAVAPDELLFDQSIRNIKSPSGVKSPQASEIILPLAPFLKACKGVGHINLEFDADGKVRREQSLIEYRGLHIPSYTLTLATLYLNVPKNKIRAELGSAIYLDTIEAPMTLRSEFLVSFKESNKTFRTYSFFDVLNDKIPANNFKNRLVLVSISAAGIMNPLSTPINRAMPLGEFSAQTVRSIINRELIRQPQWELPAELLIILVLGLLIAFLLPRLKALLAGVAFMALLLLLGGVSTFLMVSKGMWIGVTYPFVQLVLGYLGVVSIKYFVTEARKEKVEGESAETNRLLGLSFQSQGMLDMAFDKFRRVPVQEEGMKDILYSLALDYERKRQPNKAVAVYEHIEKYDGRFKDIIERKKKLIQLGETNVLGVTGPAEHNLLATGTGTRPTLGRYEVIRQLGKGAMGVVYLGQDPRINRITAIKTFRFAEDFEPEEAEKMKAKFFLEAESAGTLSHPNIVTIYDAGEEQELAFIAMEYLDGENLQSYTKKEKLLPVRKVIDYVADIAGALDYAHQKGIVHRDIKPANIMLLNTGTVKITDFGIARITATSQTQTGIVKGTPYYMSPEQISGEKVDGRSDIFSLGVMMYQLLTGRLPFFGDNLAVLMHQIMNASPPDPREHNPRIVKPLVDIMNKAMEKDREKRYQRATQMATHLIQLGKRIDELLAQQRAKQGMG